MAKKDKDQPETTEPAQPVDAAQAPARREYLQANASVSYQAGTRHYLTEREADDFRKAGVDVLEVDKALDELLERVKTRGLKARAVQALLDLLKG